MQPNENLRIGFIGSGNIAQALAKGFINSGYVLPEQISATATNLQSENLKIFKNLGCHIYDDNSMVFNHVYHVSIDDYKNQHFYLFICVKPQIILKFKNFWDFLFKINPKYFQNLMIISVMAGVKLSNIKQSIRQSYVTFELNEYEKAKLYPNENDWQLSRIMPNTACTINSGCVGLCFLSPNNNNNSDGSQQQATVNNQNQLRQSLIELLKKLGHCSMVDEQQMDPVCGLSSSGIAFVFTMMQAMADGGVLAGLPRNISTDLTIQTIMGACKMVQETGKNPIELRDKVCSPSGTTINGIHALERGSFNATIMEAIKAATERSKQFSFQ